MARELRRRGDAAQMDQLERAVGKVLDEFPDESEDVRIRRRRLLHSFVELASDLEASSRSARRRRRRTAWSSRALTTVSGLAAAATGAVGATQAQGTASQVVFAAIGAVGVSTAALSTTTVKHRKDYEHDRKVSAYEARARQLVAYLQTRFPVDDIAVADEVFQRFSRAYASGRPLDYPEGAYTLSRIPHLDVPFDDSVRPGRSFVARVYADDQSALPGEESTAIEALVPIEQEQIDVQVTLVASDHFRIAGPSTGVITIRRADPISTAVTFSLEVLSERELRSMDKPDGWLRRGALTALFTYRGRPSGKVQRVIGIAFGRAGAESPPKPPNHPDGPTLIIDGRGRRADLQVRIVDDKDEPGRSFKCEVTTDLVHIAERDAGFRRWRPRKEVAKLVEDYFDTFTERDRTPNQRLAALTGAGKELFRAAPPNFQNVFWAIMAEQRPLKTISIVSEEPYLPWELMVPVVEATGKARQPLGVEFAVARWTTADSVSAPQEIPLLDSYAIAPTYADPLLHARPEAAFVLQEFAPGKLIDPATFDNIEDHLKQRIAGLIHIACHGLEDDDGRAQRILLDNDAPLATFEVEGAAFAEDFRKARPFVFLNACKVGRLAPALVGVGGFSSTFIQLGASGVIAPIWSVKDTVAKEVAEAFYQRVLAEPSTSYAEIMQELRARAYKVTGQKAEEGSGFQVGEDSFAAYAFYGDPLASRQRDEHAL